VFSFYLFSAIEFCPFLLDPFFNMLFRQWAKMRGNFTKYGNSPLMRSPSGFAIATFFALIKITERDIQALFAAYWTLAIFAHFNLYFPAIGH